MILLLYVDDLFLTSEDELIVDAKRRLATKFRDIRLRDDALLLRHGCVAECEWDLPWSREVCSGDFEGI